MKGKMIINIAEGAGGPSSNEFDQQIVEFKV